MFQFSSACPSDADKQLSSGPADCWHMMIAVLFLECAELLEQLFPVQIQVAHPPAPLSALGSFGTA